MKLKYGKGTLQAFKKLFLEKTVMQNFGLIKEQYMGEIFKKLATRKTMSEKKADFAERLIQSLRYIKSLH